MIFIVNRNTEYINQLMQVTNAVLHCIRNHGIPHHTLLVKFTIRQILLIPIGCMGYSVTVHITDSFKLINVHNPTHLIQKSLYIIRPVLHFPRQSKQQLVLCCHFFIYSNNILCCHILQCFLHFSC